MSEHESRPGALGAALITVPVAIACLGLGAMVLSGMEGTARSVLAVLLVLGGGVGLGPLMLSTPVEPSPLKLWLFSSLLGLPLVGGTFALANGALGIEPRVAWALPFVLSGLAAGAASRRRLGVAPPGRAALGALLLGGLVGVGGWALLTSTGGASAWLADPAAVVHLTLADFAVGGAALPNPWFYGGSLEVRPAVGIGLAGLAAPGGLSVTQVLPLVGGWSLLVLTLAGYLASAAAFREQRSDGAGGRDLLAAALCLSAGGLAPLWQTVRSGGGIPVQLGLDLDPAAALSRAYWAATLLAGLHAVRRGARPWPGLTATLAGATALAQPWAGAALILLFAGPALLARRSYLVPLLMGAALPTFWAGRVHGGFSFDQVTSAGPPAMAWNAGLLILMIPALMCLRRWDRSERVSSLGLGLLGSAAVFALALAPLGWDAALLQDLALLPLALLAARGLAALGPSGAAGGSLVAAAGFLGLVGSAALVGGGVGPARAPLSVGGAGLELDGDPDLCDGLGDAFREARRVASQLTGPVALLRGGAARPAAGRSPSLAPLLAGAALWVDDAAPPGTRQPRLGAARQASSGETSLGDRWVDRRTLRDALFRDRNAWSPRFDRVLRAEVARGTTLLVIVTEQDRRRTTDRGTGPRGTDSVLVRLGAERIFEGPQVALYRLGTADGSNPKAP
ncbi:MAG: hypothetical protein ACPGPE_01470 [Planctomycetota bacterium]